MRIINSEKMYYAAGYGGQYIMVVPTRALVIAITSSSQSSGAYGTNLNRIFYEEIIGSFSSIY
jgi:CubicO group peptidase (beta-lactamase class C family)